jgi:uncharacterized alkaline shock family protein YloU
VSDAPSSLSASPRPLAPTDTGGSPLLTDQGKTSIADSVVAKIAGIAAREVSGVYAMGSGKARAVGALRERLPGSTSASPSQGVSVEVGERQAAVDLDIVCEYGVPIVDVANSVRRNVTNSIERMTGLEVTEVNVSVDDVHVEDEEPQPERVQ